MLLSFEVPTVPRRQCAHVRTAIRNTAPLGRGNVPGAPLAAATLRTLGLHTKNKMETNHVAWPYVLLIHFHTQGHGVQSREDTVPVAGKRVELLPETLLGHTKHGDELASLQRLRQESHTAKNAPIAHERCPLVTTDATLGSNATLRVAC